MNVPPIMPIILEEKDASHLRSLGICAYVYAGLYCIWGLYALFALSIIYQIDPFNPLKQNYYPMNELQLGWWVLLGLWIIAMTVLTILSARWMGQGKRWTFCLVISCIHCISFPFGLALGIFSIIVLVRPSVKNWFQSREGQ